MRLETLVNEYELEVKSAPGKLAREVNGIYVSDLLSDVIANAESGNIWIRNSWSASRRLPTGTKRNRKYGMSIP